MHAISESDIAARIARDNPWWAPSPVRPVENDYPKRVYFESFCSQALNFAVKRATVLLGPRRVGKTVLVKQLIQEAINKRILEPKQILYASVDTPLYAGMPLEKFVRQLQNVDNVRSLVIFDEIQYLKDWEVHLKDLVDSYPMVKFVATGSAAAALRLKSNESGAGRFSEFILPPLTFHEFLLFINCDEELIEVESNDETRLTYHAKNIEELNKKFIEYLNYGGYPEVVTNSYVRDNVEQFVRSDIIDKVLLKDLPALYGINDIQELNRLFSFLAYNTGQEASYENISQSAGISKPTIKRYIEYLESAFLITKMRKIDDNCRSLARERNFKVYLNNPSMRSALFAPVEQNDDTQIGHLTEAAIISQWQHSSVINTIRYARWKDGEVDIVCLSGPNQKPDWVGEVKWSDRAKKDTISTIRNIQTLIRKHPSINSSFLTTRTYSGETQIEGVPVLFMPSSLYCYTVGRNITRTISK